MNNLQETIIKYHNKLADIIDSYKFNDLMDYHLESQCGSDLALLIEEILSMTLERRLFVVGIEISDGKFKLICRTQEHSEYVIFCKANYSKNDLKEAIFSGVLEPYIKNQV